MTLLSFPVIAAVAALFATVAAAEPLPKSTQELIERRGQIGAGADMFRAPAWVRAPAKASAAPAQPVLASPAPPQPPALPFAYGGSGRVNGKRTLFLDRGSRSLRVEVGDIVDGAYRVEAIEQNRAVLRYLALDIAQVMVFGAPEATSTAPAVATRRLQGPLLLEVPDELPSDQEVPVVLGIPPGSRAAKATVQFDFDENALSIIGAQIVRPGRAVVEVSAQDAPPKRELRLKSLSTEATSTEIAIDVTAFDAQGERLAVRLPPHHITLEAVN